MIQLGTVVKVCDKTGVVLSQCIKVLGHSKKMISPLGHVVLISVKWINVKRFSFLKERKKKKFNRGTIHRALLVRCRSLFKRWAGLRVKFSENSGVLVNRRIAPFSRRVFGPILHEICTSWPWVGCVIRNTF